jgi:hypothetical protein
MMAPAQRPLRILTVAPVAAPATVEPTPGPSVVPVAGGVHMLIGEPTAEARDRAIRLVAELERAERRARPDSSVLDLGSDGRRHAAARAQLLEHARRGGHHALAIAGQLYAEHGDDARRALWRTWRPDWPFARERLDGILERAGLPAGGRLL